MLSRAAPAGPRRRLDRAVWPARFMLFLAAASRVPRAGRTGAQPNWRVADLDNPNLKPWVIEALKQANAESLTGKAMFTREARCWPTGVPAMLLNPGRLYFVQTPKEVWIIQEADHRVR